MEHSSLSDADSASDNQAKFNFRLSVLPMWAQKAALSRPSVAQQASARHQHRTVSEKNENISSKMADGKWESVSERVCVLLVDCWRGGERESNR